MASLEMKGPYRLDKATVDEMVNRKSPGNYALGRENDKGGLLVVYVGRADDDLNDRLKKHVGSHPHFKFRYATSPKAAFEKECINYHDFGGPDGDLENKIHPDVPDGTFWKCPRC